MAGEAILRGKILIDVANPLDFLHGMPPSLAVCNTDSLGEQTQRAFPETRVVKTLNTVNCNVMVNPALVSGARDMFLCGNDPNRKR
jgi:predicted dinucleotide-binding enzyme